MNPREKMFQVGQGIRSSIIISRNTNIIIIKHFSFLTI